MTNSTTTNKPVHSIRISPLNAAIWKTDTNNGPLYNVTFDRAYKTADGFGNTSSIRSRDLLLLGKLADQAYDYIMSLGNMADADEGHVG